MGEATDLIKFNKISFKLMQGFVQEIPFSSLDVQVFPLDAKEKEKRKYFLSVS